MVALAGVSVKRQNEKDFGGSIFGTGEPISEIETAAERESPLIIAQLRAKLKVRSWMHLSLIIPRCHDKQKSSSVRENSLPMPLGAATSNSST
jgi:hypothetical protein